MAKLSLSEFAQTSVLRLPQIPCRCRVDNVREEHCTFLAENLPKALPLVAAPDLVMTKTEHRYGNCCRIDIVHFYASGQTYRQLAILILAALFGERLEKVAIDLEHEASDIKRLEVNYSGFDRSTCQNYIRRPMQCTYHPEVPGRIPWNGHLDERDLPMFDLDFSEGTRYHPVNELDKRDKVEIGGGDDALVLVADLLLNLGLPGSDIAPNPTSATQDNAYVLECFLGRQRVKKWSAEAQFHLPNSFSWPGDYPSLSR